MGGATASVGAATGLAVSVGAGVPGVTVLQAVTAMARATRTLNTSKDFFKELDKIGYLQ